MTDYAIYVDPDTQQKRYRRFAPRTGGTTADFPDLSNFQFNGPDSSNDLKFACETVVEELEDDFISVFQQDSKDAQDELCNRRSDFCDTDVHATDEL